jgi:hypothetical protein
VTLVSGPRRIGPSRGIPLLSNNRFHFDISNGDTLNAQHVSNPIAIATPSVLKQAWNRTMITKPKPAEYLSSFDTFLMLRAFQLSD